MEDKTEDMKRLLYIKQTQFVTKNVPRNLYTYGFTSKSINYLGKNCQSYIRNRRVKNLPNCIWELRRILTSKFDKEKINNNYYKCVYTKILNKILANQCSQEHIPIG